MPRLARLALACAALTGSVLAGTGAHAQSNVCQEGGQFLAERRGLIEKLNGLSKGKKQMDPRAACKMFGELVTNGNKAIKWMEVNGDWCQVPPNLREGMKADNERATKFRTQACQAANKVAEMEKRARQQQQQGGGGGLLGGDGLTGPQRMPQGAL